MRPRALAVMTVVLAVAIGVVGRPATAQAAVPRPLEFPTPGLAVAVAPLPLGVAKPPLEPPPPAPAPVADLGGPPLPRFATAAAKPLPAVRDPGGFACTFSALRGAAGLAECGVHRALQGDFREAREAFEQSLAREPRGAQAGPAYVWLAELALREGRYDEAERRYRTAVALPLPGDLAPYAALGYGWVVLRRGGVGEAQRALGPALAQAAPPPVLLLARFLDGVGRLLAGRPAEAISLWDAVAASGPPSVLVEELLFWRAVAQARLGEPQQAVQALDRFLGAVPATHPLRADAIAQTGWIALGRSAPDEAVRRFLWAMSVGPRAELVPQLRAGLVRAYLALGDAARARDEAQRLRLDSLRDPAAPPALVLVAEDAARRGAPAEALDIYRELLRLTLPPPLQEYVTYRLGESLERLGGAAEAERHYRTLRDGGRVEALAQRATYRLGLLALRTQRLGEARAEGENLLRAGVVPELREAVILLTAEAAARGGDPNRAVGLFRLALRDYPASPHAPVVRLALGWVLLRDGESESALREWQEAALASDVDTAALAYLAIAEVALRQGREAQAADALREAAKLAPAHPLVELMRLNRGILLVRARAYPAAAPELEPLIPRVTDPARQALLRRALGIARYYLGEYEAAERHFRQAAHWAPAELSSWLGAGLAALARNRFTDAEDALNRARFAAAPEVLVPAYYALALVAVSRGDGDAFRQRATTFVDRYPTHPYSAVLLYGLVGVAVDRGDLDEADGWARRLLKEQPKSEYVADALLRLADGARARPPLARQAYKELLSRVGEGEALAAARIGLAEVTLGLGDAAEALSAVEGFLRDAAPGDPRTPRAYALLVQAHEAQAQRDGAIRATEAFLARFPRDPLAPSIHLRRGYLLLVEHRWEPAQQALEAAVDTGDAAVAAPAHVWLGELHRLRGEHEGAIAAYLGATYLYPDTPWAARGLQGAAQSYMGRQMPREAAILLKKLAARPGVEPALAQWAQQALTQLGPILGENPAEVLRKGAARP